MCNHAFALLIYRSSNPESQSVALTDGRPTESDELLHHCMSSSLRHRVPFTTAGDDDDERVILDDVEQDELIAGLRAQNTRTTAAAVIILDAVLVFSAVLHLIYLLNPALFPHPPLPCPALFTFLALFLHANLALRFHPHPHPFLAPLPLSYPLSYALAAVAPTLALFLAHSWPATAWAAAPALVVALAHSVHGTLREGDEALAELESLKYRAPGP
ncbi:hypothetical protein DFH09DRAFT_1162073 [Mycena vulgaris]|nr:hypothetical protein DFH09DRAFT_1162073 [Mycena vulgaris]